MVQAEYKLYQKLPSTSSSFALCSSALPLPTSALAFKFSNQKLEITNQFQLVRQMLCELKLPREISWCTTVQTPTPTQDLVVDEMTFHIGETRSAGRQTLG